MYQQVPLHLLTVVKWALSWVFINLSIAMAGITCIFSEQAASTVENASSVLPDCLSSDVFCLCHKGCRQLIGVQALANNFYQPVVYCFLQENIRPSLLLKKCIQLISRKPTVQNKFPLDLGGKEELQQLHVNVAYLFLKQQLITDRQHKALNLNLIHVTFIMFLYLAYYFVCDKGSIKASFLI